MTARVQTSKERGETDAQTCARHALETVPLVMRVIRREMREATKEQLSVPQFRVLAFLGRNRGASLSAVAEHLGVKGATASAMVDRLVKRGLVERKTNPVERRRLELGLTRTGVSLLERARGRARAFLAANLAPASPADLQMLVQGLDVLRRVLWEKPRP
jgi:DNA-binding MarR family transcriptional regulator